MIVAVRFMMDEAHAIAEAVGPFYSNAKAWAFVDKHWPDLNSDEFDVFELSSPEGYGEP